MYVYVRVCVYVCVCVCVYVYMRECLCVCVWTNSIIQKLASCRQFESLWRSVCPSILSSLHRSPSEILFSFFIIFFLHSSFCPLCEICVLPPEDRFLICRGKGNLSGTIFLFLYLFQFRNRSSPGSGLLVPMLKAVC